MAAHTVGWEELEPLLVDCTPAWGEATTGVPARLIEEAAHLYGQGPSLLWLGHGLQRQPTGGNVIRACSLLPAVTGNIGKPGAGLLYLNWNFNAPYRDLDDAYLTASHLATGTVPRLSHMDLAACLADPQRAQALVCWNINIAASNPQQARLRRALAREDLFTVVLDLFPTDTTDFADLVLPAASFLEFDDLVAGYFHLSLSAQVKVMEPLGEALPNQEIFRRLARAMGYTEPELYESDAAILATVLRKAGLVEDFLRSPPKAPCQSPRSRSSSSPICTFPPRAGTSRSPRHVPKPTVIRACRYRWPTPGQSGGRLRLLSPASPWLLNNSFANVEKIAARIGPATIALHPADAAERGLAEGTKHRGQ